jgi:Ribonuclease-III-like
MAKHNGERPPDGPADQAGEAPLPPHLAAVVNKGIQLGRMLSEEEIAAELGLTAEALAAGGGAKFDELRAEVAIFLADMLEAQLLPALGYGPLPSLRHALTDQPVSVEALGFLGSSVIGLLVSTELFTRCPDLPEAELTSLRERIMAPAAMAEIFRDVMLRPPGRPGGEHDDTSDQWLQPLTAAVIGAIYLDHGLDEAVETVVELFPPIIDRVVPPPTAEEN